MATRVEAAADEGDGLVVAQVRPRRDLQPVEHEIPRRGVRGGIGSTGVGGGDGVAGGARAATGAAEGAGPDDEAGHSERAGRIGLSGAEVGRSFVAVIGTAGQWAALGGDDSGTRG